MEMEECSSRKRKITNNDTKEEEEEEEKDTVIPNKTKKLWEQVFTTRKLPQSQYPIRKIQLWSC